jgi:hypothetical protein
MSKVISWQGEVLLATYDNAFATLYATSLGLTVSYE